MKAQEFLEARAYTLARTIQVNGNPVAIYEKGGREYRQSEAMAAAMAEFETPRFEVKDDSDSGTPLTRPLRDGNG